MLHRDRLLLLGAVSLLTITGCGSGSYSSTIGTTAATTGAAATGGSVPVTANFNGADPVAGTDDAVVATPSTDAVSVVVGASQTVSITFSSSDQRDVTGFGISASLGPLPAGWSGPATFSCASVSVASSCVLNLEYSPAAVERGTLTLDYVFIANSAEPTTTGAVTIAYAATPQNNVIARASPSGQIVGAVGAGAQSVTVNFVTDDGNAATNLVVSGLTDLPPGWSSTATSQSCAIVSTGSGCSLALTYAPTSAASGTLTLNYGYMDDSGAPRTGTYNIPYATSAGNLVATASPSGQILAVQKTGGQPVAVTFTTADGAPASKVAVTSNLTALPPGWSSAASNFSCATAGTGNGCQLRLNYAPTTLGSGTLTLSYAYTDGTGTARTGLLNIDYAATTNDNVVGTAAPSGQVTAVLGDGSRPGNGSQAVTVTFTTDDGRPATALTLTSDLAALPPGWSAASPAFACNGLDIDNVCRLQLAYAPTAAGSGTLNLNYGYKNNAGESKTAAVNIPYRTTTNDNIVWTANPSTVAVRTGSSSTVQVTFTTDDGNPAGALSVTSGLATLPAGWSSPANGLNCASVSAGTACQLSLAYAPTVAAPSSILALGFGFVNDAGLAGTGTVTIAYGATTPYLYVADDAANTLSACPLNYDNSVAACATAGTGFGAPSGVALNGSYAYVSDSQSNSLSQCTLDAGGALSACAATGGSFNAPTSITVNAGGTLAYVTQNGDLSVCAIASSNGVLSNCAATAVAYPFLTSLALSADGTHAYTVLTITTPSPASVLDVCSVATDGTLSTCGAAGGGIAQPTAVLGIQNGHLYVASAASLFVCPVNADASVGSCQATGPAAAPGGIAFIAGGSTAYVSSGSTVSACQVNADGTLGNCVMSTDPTFSGTAGLAVR